MATAVIPFEFEPAGKALQTPAGPVQILSIPWRNPESVEPEELQRYVWMLERACAKQPRNVDFRTCLGMAYAMNRDVPRSMEALEEARRIEPENFFAQLKFAELYCSVDLDRAEEETRKAMDLAKSADELWLARTQLSGIRRWARP